jgi:prepilin-type N-terminal cleavage/methylation domain-containing protein
MATRVTNIAGTFRARALRSASGFSIIELVVVIAIVLILIGIAIPTLAKVVGSSKRTRRGVATQQILVSLGAYANDFQEVYPVADKEVSSQAAIGYHQPLTDGGYFASIAEMDPDGVRGSGWLTIFLSETVVCSDQSMLPTNPVPTEDRRTLAVRHSRVAFPSQKGVLSSSWVRAASPAAVGYWCCGPGQPEAPVGFADGSVSVHAWSELVPNGQHQALNGVGSPVISTWFGFRGKDKQ